MLVASLAWSGPVCGQDEVGPPPAVRRSSLVRPPSGGTGVRNIVCDCEQSLQSEHFVAWWGSEGQGIDADVAVMLEAFEGAWSHHVDELGYPPPAGCETDKFNVYIGNTGSGTPATTATGYFWTDDEGIPYVVFNRTSLGVPGYTEPLAVHEFFHAMQHSTGNYPFDVHGNRWFWEATAQWAAGLVYPEGGQITALPSYALYPHQPIDWYVQGEQDRTLAAHHYGVFVWPEHLSEVAGHDVIRDVWTGPQASDPTEGLRSALQARGIDHDGALLDMAARTVTWDFAAGEAYAELVQEAGEPADDELPLRYGTNTIAVELPDDRFVVAYVSGDAAGDMGSPATWEARLVASADGEPLWTEPLVFRDGEGELVTKLTGDETELHLVVGPATPSADNRLTERFDYGAIVSGRRCGCASARAPEAWWIVVLMGIMGRRRTRAEARPPALLENDFQFH